MSDEVRRAIVAAVEEHGPLTFAAFMEHALYGPGGFYERPPVGPSGDFVTSPHIHPVFGELLGRALRELWEPLGRPDPWHVVEVGAGDGTLAQQVRAALEGTPAVYGAVDVGSGARQALVEAGIERVGDHLEPPADVVLANELLDNLPFRVVRHGREVRIGVEGGDLVEVLAEPDEDLAPLLREVPDDEGELVVPVGSFRFVDDVAVALRRAGYALLIDYGGVGSSGGQLHGYRGQRLVAGVLEDPGGTDVTAGVDFSWLARHAERVGLHAFPSVTQHDALIVLGFEDWFREELSRQHDALATRDGLTAVRAWSGRSRASILADPGGLGRFRWLLLATPGLPAPPWLERALAQ